MWAIASDAAEPGHRYKYLVHGADGRTVLVEVNDAFSLGGYGLDTSDLVDLYMARWQEIVAREERGVGGG